MRTFAILIASLLLSSSNGVVTSPATAGIQEHVRARRRRPPSFEQELEKTLYGCEVSLKRHTCRDRFV